MRITNKLKIFSLVLGIEAVLFVSVPVYAASPASSFGGNAGSSVLTLPDVLRLSEDYNPDLKAAKAQEIQAQQEVTIQQSFYYPTLNLEGQSSAGFPGSNQHGILNTGRFRPTPTDVSFKGIPPLVAFIEPIEPKPTIVG